MYIYPAKEFLRWRFNVDFNVCQFCHNDLEYIFVLWFIFWIKVAYK